MNKEFRDLITLNKEYSVLLKDTVTEYLNPNYIYLPVNDDKSESVSLSYFMI